MKRAQTGGVSLELSVWHRLCVSFFIALVAIAISALAESTGGNGATMLVSSLLAVLGLWVGVGFKAWPVAGAAALLAGSIFSVVYYLVLATLITQTVEDQAQVNYQSVVLYGVFFYLVLPLNFLTAAVAAGWRFVGRNH